MNYTNYNMGSYNLHIIKNDNFITGEKTTSTERQNSFTKMMEVALEAAINL